MQDTSIPPLLCTPQKKQPGFPQEVIISLPCISWEKNKDLILSCNQAHQLSLCFSFLARNWKGSQPSLSWKEPAASQNWQNLTLGGSGGLCDAWLRSHCSSVRVWKYFWRVCTRFIIWGLCGGSHCCLSVSFPAWAVRVCCSPLADRAAF